jgi:hypothetical protein
LTTASASSVVLTNGTSPCNVYWAVGSSATLGTGTNFSGVIIAEASITLDGDDILDGRGYALTGSITISSASTITRCDCPGDKKRRNEKTKSVPRKEKGIQEKEPQEKKPQKKEPQKKNPKDTSQTLIDTNKKHWNSDAVKLDNSIISLLLSFVLLRYF